MKKRSPLSRKAFRVWAKRVGSDVESDLVGYQSLNEARAFALALIIETDGDIPPLEKVWVVSRWGTVLATFGPMFQEVSDHA